MSFARDAGGDSGAQWRSYMPLQLLRRIGAARGRSSSGRALGEPGRRECGTAVALARVAYWLRVPRMSNAVLGLRLKQQLTLTPRLQQSVKLLQLSALECVQELHQAIAQNPFLEETADTDSRSHAAPRKARARRPPTPRISISPAPAAVAGGGGEDTPDWTEWTASPSTLRDSLREQLLLLGLTERDYVLANLIVDALDEDGFLRQPLEELAALTARRGRPGELETALRIVQTLEPSGIAARNLGECLSLQLQALDRARRPAASSRSISCRTRLALMAARDNTPPAGGARLHARGSAHGHGADPQPRSAARLEGRHFRAARDRSGCDRAQGEEALAGQHQRGHLSAHSRQPAVRGLLPPGARRRDGAARAASAGSALAGAQSGTALPDDSARRRGGRRAAAAISSSTATSRCGR